MHDSLSRTFTKGSLKLLVVVLAQVIPDEWLASIFVDSLENFVPRGVSQSREQGKELAGQSRTSVLLEDNSVQLANAVNLASI